MPRALLTVTVAIVALCAAAPAAGAATVAVGLSCLGDVCGEDPHFTAAPGEANDLRVSQNPDRTAVLRDNGAPITPGKGCQSVDANEVRCSSTLGTTTVDTGDGDDRVEALSGTFASVNGGIGSDRISGARFVSYAGRSEPIVVDLAAGTGGAAGENDVITGAPSIRAGDGDDVLRGTEGGDALHGVGGNDTLVGLGGDDLLDGGAGRDSFDAGEGADRLVVQEPGGAAGPGERVACGAGADAVGALRIDNLTFVDQDDLLAEDCERVQLRQLGQTVVAPHITARRALLHMQSSCRCAGRLTLTTTSGGKRVTLARGPAVERARRVAAPLTATGRRLLARPRRYTVRVTWSGIGMGREGYTTFVRGRR